MTSPNKPKEVKALDGTIDMLNDASDPPVIPSKAIELPLRPNIDGKPQANNPQPLPGHALTGKQEHCKATAILAFEAKLRVQTLKGSCCHSKSTMRSQNWLPLLHYNASVPHFAQTTAKSPQSTPTFPSCGSYSSIMSATSPSSIKPEKKSFGRTSFNWCEIVLFKISPPDADCGLVP